MRIQKIDVTKTRIIFFDLEFYVPEKNRKEKGFSYNPWQDGSIFLGGSYVIALGTRDQVNPLDDDLKKRIKSLWIWNSTNEKELVGKFFKLFKSQLDQCIEASQGVSPLICGIGIQNSDIPVLMALFRKHGYLNESQSFAFENSLRILDLSVLGIGFFNNKTYLMYPKKKNELLNKFFQDQVFESGVSVWEQYEDSKYDDIQSRNEKEVFYTLRLYYEFKRKIMSMKEIEGKYIKLEKLRLKESEGIVEEREIL